MRDELLDETLFLGLAHACTVVRARVEDYNIERSHSFVGDATLAFAAEIEKQRPGCVQVVASGAFVHHIDDRCRLPAG